jgi:hypothetical protein
VPIKHPLSLLERDGRDGAAQSLGSALESGGYAVPVVTLKSGQIRGVRGTTGADLLTRWKG